MIPYGRRRSVALEWASIKSYNTIFNPSTTGCWCRCHHSRCPRSCGRPCEPCREPCLWTCPHHGQCSRLCHEPCDRPRCDEPCLRRLAGCGHQCIGLCGETCPTKCRVCDRDEVTELFFGTEDEPDARFVQLEDCRHIFEVSSNVTDSSFVDLMCQFTIIRDGNRSHHYEFGPEFNHYIRS